MTDHYATLGIPRDCDASVIIRAWREAASRYHPDKVVSGLMDSPEDLTLRQAQASQKFQAAREAFNVLMDHDARARYDANLNGAADPGLLSEDDYSALAAGGIDAMGARAGAFAACMMCNGTREVRVAAAGFWTRRKCPACA